MWNLRWKNIALRLYALLLGVNLWSMVWSILKCTAVSPIFVQSRNIVPESWTIGCHFYSCDGSLGAALIKVKTETLIFSRTNTKKMLYTLERTEGLMIESFPNIYLNYSFRRLSRVDLVFTSNLPSSLIDYPVSP